MSLALHIPGQLSCTHHGKAPLAVLCSNIELRINLGKCTIFWNYHIKEFEQSVAASNQA